MASMEEVLALAGGRSGHFLLESGSHTDLWLDLESLLVRPRLLRPLAAELARRLAAHGVEVVCGPLTGGAFLAQHVAAELDAAFVYAERWVTPAGAGFRIPAGMREAVRGRRVALVDDAISAGSAAGGAMADVHACGGVPAAIGALLVVAGGAERLASANQLPLERLAERPIGLWEPAVCPLCAAGVPLRDLTGAGPG
jgi:orotate phosphoribosyltransferase